LGGAAVSTALRAAGLGRRRGRPAPVASVPAAFGGVGFVGGFAILSAAIGGDAAAAAAAAAARLSRSRFTYSRRPGDSADEQDPAPVEPLPRLRL
jgi:hypothetical protein